MHAALLRSWVHWEGKYAGNSFRSQLTLSAQSPTDGRRRLEIVGYKYVVAYDVTVYPAGMGEGESREGGMTRRGRCRHSASMRHLALLVIYIGNPTNPYGMAANDHAGLTVPPSSVGIRQPLACKNFDEGLGQCVVEEMDDPDVDCDVPVDEANCDMDQQPTDFWGQAKKCGPPCPLSGPLCVSGVQIDRSAARVLFPRRKAPRPVDPGPDALRAQVRAQRADRLRLRDLRGLAAGLRRRHRPFQTRATEPFPVPLSDAPYKREGG